jgi:hypothetical protein
MAIVLPKMSKGPQPPQRLSRLKLPPSEVAAIEAKYPPGIMTSLKRIDSIGAVIFIIWAAGILLGLNWGSTDPRGWNQPKVIATLVVGGALIPVFVLWEYVVDHSTDHLVESSPSTHDIEGAAPQEKVSLPKTGIRARLARLTPEFVRITDPIVPMNMFRSYDVVATSFITLTSGMVMLGIFYFVAIFYVIVSGNDAVKAGVQLLYFAPGIVSHLFLFTNWKLILFILGPGCPLVYVPDQEASSTEAYRRLCLARSSYIYWVTSSSTL